MSGDRTQPGGADGSGGHETLLTLASLGLIAEHLNQPVFAKNMALEFVLLNPAYCALVGKSREQLLGRTEQSVFGDQAVAKYEAADRQVLANRQAVIDEQHFGSDAGPPRPTTKLPLGDSSGRVTHVVCVVGHAGDAAASAKKVEEELERYAQERTRALRAVQEQLLKKERLMVLGQLAAGLAHQIRNPLGAISNGIALVRRQLAGLNNPVVHEALQIANDEIWEANRIIGDLLEYARIRPPVRQDAQLAPIVEAAVASEPVADNIRVRIDVGDHSVHVDEVQVGDAIGNIVRNAREAMPEGGALTITSQRVGDLVELRLEDTGGGVAQEHRHLIFEPLVTSKPLGIGLGLPTASALLLNQGAQLECTDAAGSGACFVIRLPINQPTEESDAD